LDYLFYNTDALNTSCFRNWACSYTDYRHTFAIQISCS